MEQAALDSIRDAVRAAHEFAHSPQLDSCDADDVDEVIAALDQELSRPNPNKNTLTTYLGSLVRSLRAQPAAQEVRARLDAAMRKAGLPTPAL